MRAQKSTVLLAEDDEDDYLLTKDAFESCCPNVDLAWVRDGEELLDYMHRRGRFEHLAEPTSPDIILLDLNMPKKDGREALREIKSFKPFSHIPVVILTTSNSPDDIIFTYQAGGNSFIRKPASYKEFVEFIKTFDNYWFGMVKLPDRKT